MNAAAFRNLARTLPHVEETEWDDKLVYWVGDKAVGGKMFAVLRLELPDERSRLAPRVLSLSVGPDRYHELLEREGITPAPYLARAHWIALEDWDALPTIELQALAHHAHALTYAKLQKQTKALLVQPDPAYRKAIAHRRRLLQNKRER